MKSVLVFLFAVVVFACEVDAQPGFLDDSFGDNGVVFVSPELNSNVQLGKIALSDQGQIIVAGSSEFFAPDVTDFIVLRFNNDGSPDSSFGAFANQSGYVNVPWSPSRHDFCNGLALQSTGNIVLTGKTGVFETQEFVAGRLLQSDGNYDFDFGDLPDQAFVSLFENNNFLWQVFPASGAMAIDSQDRIVVCDQDGAQIIVMRVHPDGNGLDETFGVNGVAVVDSSSINGSELPFVVKILTDGSMLIAANLFYIDPKTNLTANKGFVFKLDNLGQVQAFGQPGNNNFADIEGIEDDYIIYDLIERNGQIFVCGLCGSLLSPSKEIRGFVASLDANGIPKADFAQDGIFKMGHTGTVLNSLGVESSGNIVFGGWQRLQGVLAWRPLALRLKPDGRIDPGYGNSGVSFFECGFSCRPVADGVLAADDKFYLTAWTADDAFVVLRINGGSENILGDVNDDGLVNLLDVVPFVMILTDGDDDPAADANCDGVVDLLDVQSFIDLVTQP